MPPTQHLSRRNIKARSGWHGKGYRNHGDLFFKLKRSFWGSAAHSREFSINENRSLSKLLWEMHSTLRHEEGGDLPNELHFEFHYKGIILPSDEMVKSRLDGGETVNVKVFDDEGREWLLFDDVIWELKAPPRQRALQDARLLEGMPNLMGGDDSLEWGPYALTGRRQ